MNGSTMGEYLGWSLAIRIGTLGWMMERQADGGREFVDSPQGAAQRAGMRELGLVLWPNRVDPDEYLRVVDELRGLGPRTTCDDVRPPGPDVSLIVIRPTYSLLGNPPAELFVEPTLAGVAHRIWCYLDADKTPDTVLTHHLAGGGRQPTDGLRVPAPGKPWTIREHITNTWRRQLDLLDETADVAIRLQAADAAASLVLVGRAWSGDRIVPHTPSPETIGLACDRLAWVANGPWLERLRGYAVADRHPLGDVVALHGEAPSIAARETDPTARWQAEIQAAVSLMLERGQPVSLRIGVRDNGPVLNMGLGGA